MTFASTPSCTLSINACVTDVPFLFTTVSHLVRACRYPFREKMLVIDTAPMKGRYRDQELPRFSELAAVAEQLVSRGVIDQVIEVDYQPSVRNPILAKHLGRAVRETHDFRDAPIYAYLFAYEAATADYFLHFDADMLLYQAEDFNWIQTAIDCLDQNPDILTITPLPGPPQLGLELKQRGIPYRLNPNGYFEFKEFTARRYLLDRRRFDRCLPLPLSHVSWKRQLAAKVTGRSAIERWEGMVTNKLLASPYIRADLASPQAWTLHAINHDAQFLRLLPQIIDRIERGDYPAAQAGDYDLQLDLWESSPVCLP